MCPRACACLFVADRACVWSSARGRTRACVSVRPGPRGLWLGRVRECARESVRPTIGGFLSGVGSAPHLWPFMAGKGVRVRMCARVCAASLFVETFPERLLRSPGTWRLAWPQALP